MVPNPGSVLQNWIHFDAVLVPGSVLKNWIHFDPDPGFVLQNWIHFDEVLVPLYVMQKWIHFDPVPDPGLVLQKRILFDTDPGFVLQKCIPFEPDPGSVMQKGNHLMLNHILFPSRQIGSILNTVPGPRSPMVNFTLVVLFS